MPSLKSLGLTPDSIPRSTRDITVFPNGKNDPAVPYSNQHYYDPEWARKLEATCKLYLTNSHRGGWNFHTAKVAEKHLRMVLMASRSYILTNPHEFDPAVVELLDQCGFSKRGVELVLTPRRVNTGRLTRNTKLDLDVCFNVPDPNVVNSTGVKAALGESPESVTPSIPRDPADYTYILEAIKELIFTKPVQTACEFNNLNLTTEGVFEIKALLAGAGDGIILARVEKTRVKAVKVTDNLPKE